MRRLTGLVAIMFGGVLLLVLALTALAGASAAAMSSASLLGLVCLAGLLGVFGLLAGAGVGYVVSRTTPPREAPPQQTVIYNIGRPARQRLPGRRRQGANGAVAVEVARRILQR